MVSEMPKVEIEPVFGKANPPFQDQKAQPTEIDAVLSERGSRYGSFDGHAEIVQMLKRQIAKYAQRRECCLAPDQQEALDMICHKIGRIINGDPDYIDNWIDIAGYAKLVADRLQADEIADN